MSGGGQSRGVRIAGSGSAVPDRRLTNADLEKLMDTTNEWIVQRTGIHERRVADLAGGETTSHLATEALSKALDEAHLKATDLDLIIVATMTPDMPCPPTACQVANAVGAGSCGAFDLGGACSGFVYGLNVAHEIVRAGTYNTIALIGADTLTRHMDYSTAGRGTAILFGDAAGAVILRATDDTSQGIIAQAMHSDGRGWKDIYVPEAMTDFPPDVEPDPTKLNHLQMSGQTVFRFAVTTFSDLIEETLNKAGLKPTDVDMYVCHQSNARILNAARDRFGLPHDLLYINIDRYGNTVAASVPLCFDELRKRGRIREGQKVMFVAFGGGLTWSSSLWQL